MSFLALAFNYLPWWVWILMLALIGASVIWR
jgi:hypothetical protein